MALTIRPSEEFTDHIDKLKKRLGVKAATTVIDTVVLDYGRAVDQLNDTQQQLHQTEQRLNDLVRILKRKSDIEKRLTSFLDDHSENDLVRILKERVTVEKSITSFQDDHGNQKNNGHDYKQNQMSLFG